MTIELTPAVVLSLIGVLVVLGGLVWRLAAKTDSAASREDLAREISTIRAVLEARIADRSKESQVQHEQLAHKSALTRLDAELLDLKKEIREDMKEMSRGLERHMAVINSNYSSLLASVTGLAAQLSGDIERRKRESRNG